MFPFYVVAFFLHYVLIPESDIIKNRSILTNLLTPIYKANLATLFEHSLQCETHQPIISLFHSKHQHLYNDFRKKLRNIHLTSLNIIKSSDIPHLW